MGKAAVLSAKRQPLEKVAEAGCPNEPKIDPRVRRTHKLLMDAFRELLAERSYDSISVGDIADRATINRATVYAHFQDKAHLAETMLRADLESAIVARLAPPADFGPESVTRVAAATFEFMAGILGQCRKHADQLAGSLGLALQSALEGCFLKWFAHSPEAHRRFRGITEETMANALAWAIYGAAIRWSQTPRRPAAEAAARETVDVFFR